MKLKGLLRLISFFQLIYPASFKSAFRQVIGSSEKDGQLMINKVFFMCDRDASCTHVVKLDETRKFKVLHGFAEIDSMVGKISLWEKVAVDVDACTSTPCKNNGKCRIGPDQFICDCPVGYGGATCEAEINECKTNPCQNGGTCHKYVGFYNCSCATGWSGTNCDDIDECSSNPCLYGGTCIDGKSMFTCSCKLDYSGTRCDTAPTGYTFGDGSGGNEQHVATVASRDECVNLCRGKSNNPVTANGITLDSATQRSCYCEYGQTGVSSSTSWINRYI